jgi:nucleic acid/nucleotide deaminase of polymorphic system toxin
LIKTIIRIIHNQLQFSDLQEFLARLDPGSSSWSGNTPASVIRRYQKLAQYVSAASYLRRIVRKSPNWQICDIGIEFNRTELFPPAQGAAASFLQCSLTTGTKKERSSFRNNLELKLGKTCQVVESGIQRIVTENKCVHAGIQLLFYYFQDSKVLLRPRVLHSNKETCYLCNLFIETHGQFYTPKTHGILYTKWRLLLADEINLKKIG